MSVKTDAETIMDRCQKIVSFEILKQRFQANGGAILADPDNPDSAVTLNAQQRQQLLALEDGWWSEIKTLASGH